MNYSHMKGPGDLPYPGDPQDEDSFIAERAEELAHERFASEQFVTEALDEACGFSSYSDHFTADLARFFIAYDAAMTNDAGAQAADDLFKALLPHIKAQIEPTCQVLAQSELDNRQTGPEE